MLEDMESRYDEKKPFDVIRAEDLGGDLYEFYEPLENLIRVVSGVDISGKMPVFLIGGRGTGKTMVLKYLSLEMQLKDFIKEVLRKQINPQDMDKEEMMEFLSKKSFLGIYLHFRITEYDAITGELEQLFLPYLSIKIAEQLLKLVSFIKYSNILLENEETNIIQYFKSQIKEPKLDCDDTIEGALGQIRSKIIPLFETIFEKSSYYTLEEIKKEYSIPIIISNNNIFGLSNLAFSEIDALRGKNLFILLDELEFLKDYQLRGVAKLIKDSEGTSVIFKIGSRYMPNGLEVGDSSEFLQESHDFRIIKITDSLNGAHSMRKEDYDALIKNILNKRLSKSKTFREAGIEEIEQLFPNQSIEEEARLLVANRTTHWTAFKAELLGKHNSEEIDRFINILKYPDNPIIEKLNMLLFYRRERPEEIKKMYEGYLKGENERYRTLYQKNSLALLFQLCRDYRTEKKYVGIDVYISLSSGIIRNAIELCNQALTTAYNYNYKADSGKSIDYRFQDMGAKSHAELQYEDIARIKGNLGLRAQMFINELGTVLRHLHSDRDIIEPEPTHFETTYSEITGIAKEVFDATKNYAYLQEKPPMSPKSSIDTKKNDYLINRILAPKFGISYRLRGRTRITPSQIQKLITGDEKERREIRKEIFKRNSKKKTEQGIQKTLFDLGGR